MDQSKKIYFEEADRPPPSYYKEGSMSPDSLSRMPFQTPDPEKWLQAPTFVPRSRKMLEDSFGNETPPPVDANQNIADGSPPVFSDETLFRTIDNLSTSIFEEPVNPFISKMPPSLFGSGAPPYYPAPYPVPLGRGSLPPQPIPSGLPFPMAPPFPGPHPLQNGNPLSFVPQGYSANITNINAGIGPPIPAIVLRKKRRKRNKNHTQSMLIEGEKDSASPPAPSDPNEYGTEGTSQRIDEGEETPEHELHSHQKVLGGSCPDLTEDQLTLWDNYLYDAIVEENARNPPPPAPSGGMRASQERRIVETMQTSAYEIVPRAILDVAEQAVDGISSHEIRKLDREINGNMMTASTIMTNLRDTYAKGIDTEGSTEKSLASEMEELSFRPEISKYGYPQYDSDRQHVATFHPDGIKTTVISLREDNGAYVEDCFEGMNIRVNTFEDEDLALSESDCPEPSRFQKLQWAIKNGNTVQLQPPDRVCCSIM